MALVKVLSEQTEAELRTTLKVIQVSLVSLQNAIQSIERTAAKVERAMDALMTAGKDPDVQR